MRFASASTPGNTGTLSPQPLDALEKHLDSLESEPSNGLGHEVRAKARQALQCLLEGNRRFCQVRAVNYYYNCAGCGVLLGERPSVVCCNFQETTSQQACLVGGTALCFQRPQAHLCP